MGEDPPARVSPRGADRLPPKRAGWWGNDPGIGRAQDLLGMDGLVGPDGSRDRRAPDPGTAAGPFPQQLGMRLWVQTGESPYQRRALDAATLAGMNPTWRGRVEDLQGHPGVREVVGWVTEGGASPPVDVVLSGEGRTSYHRDGMLVLTGGGLERGRERESFLRVALHELGHALQWRSYRGWLPPRDYAASEGLVRGGDRHQLDKPTSRGSAWVEGFAEAIAAGWFPAPPIERFAYRRTILEGLHGRRDLAALRNVEGFTACLLHDFWRGPRGAARRARTLEVLRAGRRHPGVLAYLVDHVRLFPRDALRWELTLAADSLLGGSLGGRIPPEAAGEIARLRTSLQDLARRHGRLRVAQAAWRVLGDELDPSRLPGALAAEAQAQERVEALEEATRRRGASPRP